MKWNYMVGWFVSSIIVAFIAAISLSKYTGFADLIQSWPVLVLFLLILFWAPIYRLLSGISDLFGRAGSLEVYGVKWTATELDEVALDRETLRANILIATAGSSKMSSEMKKLVDSAGSADLLTKRLTEERRREVLGTSFRLAAEDGVVSTDELKALQKIAVTLDLDGKIFHEEYDCFKNKWPQYQFENYVDKDGRICEASE